MQVWRHSLHKFLAYISNTKMYRSQSNADILQKLKFLYCFVDVQMLLESNVSSKIIPGSS